ncbi:MAG: iron chelate uptake ABC transporter family permease subunit [Firmicutes bacterium]|nr:iron chelate uptake ABC transporter family permease subunit [Bacillota bacterium]MCL2255689.1 iron chelate uptake ABC transporter family permease subunit [Bacillota bacterium]
MDKLEKTFDDSQAPLEQNKTQSPIETIEVTSTKKKKTNKVLLKIGAFFKKPYSKLVICSAVLAGVMALYLFYGLLGLPREIILFDLVELRLMPFAAMVLVSVCVGYSTVTFQTVTNARILTPGVLGFENIYMFIQTFIVFALGSAYMFLISGTENFIISVVAMVVVAGLIFIPMLTRGGTKGVFTLLLVGMILSTFFASLTTLMQYRIDPDEFLVLQALMFPSFSSPNSRIVLVSAIIILVTLLFTPSARRMDVLSLGRETSISLGVNHKFMSIRLLVMVAALVSVSTALAGPMMFLGLLAANLSYQIMKTHKHKYTIPVAILISAVAVFTGQFLIEHVFTSPWIIENIFGGRSITVPIAVMINFVGGIYFIILLLKERKKAK